MRRMWLAVAVVSVLSASLVSIADVPVRAQSNVGANILYWCCPTDIPSVTLSEFVLDAPGGFSESGGWAVIDPSGPREVFFSYEGIATYGNGLVLENIRLSNFVDREHGYSDLPAFPLGCRDDIEDCAQALEDAGQYPCHVILGLPCYSQVGATGGSVTYFDSEGNVLREEIIPRVLTADVGYFRAQGGDTDGSASVTYYWEQHTLLGFTAYRWNQTKSWSWGKAENQPNRPYDIVRKHPHWYGWASDMDSFQSYQGLTAADPPFDRPEDGYGTCLGGWERCSHHSRLDAEFCNIFPLFGGCISATHPSVWIMAAFDGGWLACAEEDSTFRPFEQDWRCGGYDP